MKIPEIQRGKEEIYGGVKRESERRQILDDYSRVEGVYNQFLKQKISAQVLSRSLGDVIVGTRGEHASAQIYAYELLLKSLAEAATLEDENKIIDEALFDAAVEDRSVKKEYLLGLLAYFSSSELTQLRQKEERGGIVKAEEQKIFFAFQNYLSNLTPARSGTLHKEMKDLAALISNDFPTTSEDGQTARLVAKYYANEQQATAPPGPKRSIIVDVFSQGQAGSGGSGKPERIYVLPPGYHTSAEKIREAEAYRLPLLTEIAQIQNTSEGKEKKALLWDISAEESLRYIKKLRDLKDRNDFKGAKKFMEDYRQTLWDQLDEYTRQEFGGQIENVEILVQTIRDESVDALEADQPEQKKVMKKGA